MIAKISFDYGFKPSPEQLTDLRKFFPKADVAPVKLDDKGKPTWESEHVSECEGIADVEAFMRGCPWAEFKVGEVYPSTGDGIVPAIERLNARAIKLSVATWTNRPEAVTCPKCLKILKETPAP